MPPHRLAPVAPHPWGVSADGRTGVYLTESLNSYPCYLPIAGFMS